MSYPELEALRAQADLLDELVAELDEADWSRPTRCPPWSVFELFGHLVGTIRFANSLLDEVDAEPSTDRQRWNVGTQRTEADQESVREGTAAYIEGKTVADLRGDWDAAKKAMPEGLDGDPNAVVGDPARRTIRRADLADRNVRELGIHTMDLGHATLRGERITPEASAILIDTFNGQLGEPLPPALGWDAKTYILTASGRRQLEPNERHTLGALADRFPLIR